MISDEDRWAEAQSVLDGAPTQSAEERVARWRRLTILSVVGLVLLTAALGVALFGWLGVHESDSGPDDGPLWRVITGLVVTTGAAVLSVTVAVTQWRAHRGRYGWRSPLVALSRAQRRALADQVRGKAPVDPARLPLVRHLAETLSGQRSVVVLNLAMLLLFTGQLIRWPSPWRLAVLAVFGLLSLIVLPLVLRNERQARRFLAEHPPEERSVA